MSTYDILIRIQPDETKTFQDPGGKVFRFRASTEKLLGIAHGVRAAQASLRVAISHGGQWKNIVSLIGTTHERIRGRQGREGPYLLTDSACERLDGDGGTSFDDYNFVYSFWTLEFVHGFFDAYLWLNSPFERTDFMVRDVKTGKTFRVR